jgi:Zn-dependent protease with chaperone function
MSLAVCLLAYSLVVLVLAPPLLRRVAHEGAVPRLSIAAWLAAMASVLGAWLVVSVLLVVELARSWGHLDELLAGCFAALRALALHGHSGLVRASLAAMATLTVVAFARLSTRLLATLRRGRVHTRRHAEAAILAARGGRPGPEGSLVVDDERPGVYCLAGRPHTIVITRAALTTLNDAQLGAVLAHEHAHLHGRHHLLLAVTGALAKILPGPRLFTDGAAEIARLVEMCADDVAARRHGGDTVVDALVALTIGTPKGAATPASALGAAGVGVADRVQRLVCPPNITRAWCAHTLTVGLLLLGPIVAVELIMTQSFLRLPAMS